VLDRFSVFGLPIHFTENTLTSGHLMPKHIEDLNDYQIGEWPSTPEGEERQARELDEMLTVLFEHPLVEAFTNWNFSDDGAWLGAPAGLIRKDNTPKPAYEVMKKRIKEDWSTNLTARTDADGTFAFEGFLGEYELVCKGEKLSFRVDKGVDIETFTINYGL